MERQSTNELAVKWPQPGKVEVGPNVDFIYIMRKDGDFTMAPIAHSVAETYHLGEEKTKQILLEKYDEFFSKLSGLLLDSYSSKGNVELHLFDHDQLNEEIHTKANGNAIVSLDPLTNQGVLKYEVSRGYHLSGTKDFGQVSRPGSDLLPQQAKSVSDSLNGSSAVVVEDDMFSGGSVINSLIGLDKCGVNVQKLVLGIQVGKSSKLSEMGIQVDPVVIYETTDGTDIFDKVDLGDPRDYLVGASGLVVKLPNGHFARAPYILPFVSTSARAGIPKEVEKQFAVKVLHANLEFHQGVEELIGKPILLKNMDPGFVILMNELFGFDSNTPMTQVVSWSINNIDAVWEISQKLGEFQEKLAKLNLPENIVFIDVNGTLFSDDSQDGHIPEPDLELFKKVLAVAKQKGVSVGLCSDSPLPQLQKLAEKLGIEGPIVAENGNMLCHGEQTLTLSTLSEIAGYKSQIVSLGTSLGFNQAEDCVSPEFGGTPIGDGNWSFGAGRETSITVFGPKSLIEKLGQSFQSNGKISVDCSPDYNFFAIHPGSDYKTNKGSALSLLAQHGHSITMIGNSMSDWVSPDTGVACTFVGGSRISSLAKDQSAYLSSEPLMTGVNDILTKVVYKIPSEFQVVKQLSGGEINDSFLVNKNGQDYVLQLANGVAKPEYSSLCPYLHPDKFQKAMKLEANLLEHGIPVPKVVNYGEGKDAAWVAFEVCPGVNLSEDWKGLSQEQKLLVTENMAKMLAKIHSVPVDNGDKVSPVDIKTKHETKLVQTVEALVDQNILNAEQASQILTWYGGCQHVLPNPLPTLVHRDFFQRNIFVNPQTLEITGVIDWADTADIDDPVKDAVLAAWWIADNLDTPENQEIFLKFLQKYNKYSKEPANIDYVQAMLNVYNLQWYLELALFESQRGNQEELTNHIKRALALTDK